MTRLHHLAITTADLKTSTAFYDAILSPLGYQRGHTSVELCTWGGQEPEILVYVVEGDDSSPHTLGRPGWHHAAFEVDERHTVAAVHQAAVEGNWRVLHDPKDYPDYADGYHAVFLIDPDGLKVEIAHIPVPVG